MTGSRVRHIGVVVPAYDVAPTLAWVVRGARMSLASLGRPIVVVIDDGSTDATPDIARTVSDILVTHAVNRGKGAALRAGIDHALGAGCDSLLTLDADGQHDTSCAPALIAALEHADLVLGTRRRSGSRMPLHRRWTNRLSDLAVSRYAGLPIADSQSGYRAIRATLARAVRPAGDRYEFETEFLLLAARGGYRIASVPVPTLYPTGIGSHFRLAGDTARVVRTIWGFRPGATL